VNTLFNRISLVNDSRPTVTLSYVSAIRATGVQTTGNFIARKSWITGHVGSIVSSSLCITLYYIFAFSFLFSIFYLFFSPNLGRRRLDVYHISTHGVALVRI